MNAEIITVGDEILFGHIVDTNSAFIGQRLSDTGISLEWITSVGDHYGRAMEAFRTAWGRVDAVLVTGGLGPTHDDITKTVFCDLFGLETRLDQKVLEHIRERFRRRGIDMPESNVCQAMIPVGSSILWNPVGTAPGIHLARDGRHIFLMPGVPREMERMMADHVLPILTRHAGGQVIHHLTLRTSGISESALFELIRDVDGLDCVASLPKLTGIDLRITVKGPDEGMCRTRAGEIAGQIRTRAGAFIYAEGTDRFEKLLVEELRRRGLKVAVAEACTGGGVACRLTEAPEVGEVLIGAVVAENEQAVAGLVGVSREVILQSGLASATAAEAMAGAVRRTAGADVGLATTGICGPGGGTESTPVGTLFVGVAVGDRTTSERHVFGTDRVGNRERMAQAALSTLMKTIRTLER